MPRPRSNWPRPCLAQAPQNPEGHYWLALSHQGLGEKALALSAIDKAIELAPERNDFTMIRSIMQLGEQIWAPRKPA